MLEKLIRPVLVYLVLVFGLLKFGKRVLAQLNPFDLVVLLTLSNTVQNAIIGNDTSLSGGILGAAASARHQRAAGQDILPGPVQGRSPEE